MKIWSLWDPEGDVFARASRMGAWSADDRRIRPLVIEWEPGSDIVGDFTWPGFGDSFGMHGEIVITEQVAKALKENGVRGFELGPVEVKDHSETRVRRLKRKKRVGFPYKGPKLYEVWVTAWVQPDESLTTFGKGPNAPLIEGKENVELVEINEAGMEDFEVHHSRVPGKGLFIRHKELKGVGLFRIPQGPAAVLCTDDVKRMIEENGFTNVSFLEDGEVVD